MAGQSRSKDGVVSLAYAGHPASLQASRVDARHKVGHDEICLRAFTSLYSPASYFFSVACRSASMATGSPPVFFTAAAQLWCGG